MAVFTSVKKYFEVTALSFAPAVIAFGEETSYSITVKNVSGKKISSMYAGFKLFYKDTSGIVRQSVYEYMYGGPAYEFKSISWASGASKTFTGKFRITGAYAHSQESRLLANFVGSDAGYTNYPNESLGLMLDFTTGATFADGSGDDQFFNLRGAGSEYLKVFDSRYVPAIPKFAAERSTGSTPDDEGENALANIKLSLRDDTYYTRLSLQLRYRDKAVGGTYTSVNLSSLMQSALAAEISTAVTNTFGKNSDWELLLWYGDEFESATAALVLSRSFANLHLSGASTGGVCFGSFSKATEGNPVFQCYYPAVLYEGIEGGWTYSAGEVDTGGKWIDGKRIYRYVWRGTTTLDGAQGTVATLPAVPETVISLRGMFKRSDGAWLPIPNTYYSSLNYSANIRTDADGNIIAGFGSSYDGTKEIIVIAEYTK